MRYVIHLRLRKLRSPWGRNLVHNVAGISETLQEPMFYGPIDGSEKPFVLLAQANPGTQTPGGGGAGPSLPPAPTTVADKTGVLVSGTDGSIKSSIASALQQSDFARFETYPLHESSYWKNSVRSDSPLPKIHSNHKNRSDSSKCPSKHIEGSESLLDFLRRHQNWCLFRLTCKWLVSIQNDVSFRDRISHDSDFRLRSLATSQRMIIVIMTTAPPADPAGFLASKEAIDAIDRICRRCSPDETEAVECSNYIIEHLMADDCRRLRLFQARNMAKFQTYLTTLINALATDFSRGRYGRKRIPKVVSRMGETAEKVYILICWKNYSFSEGFDILCIRHEYSGSFQDYETRFGPVQAAPCRRNPVRFSIDNIDGPACDLPDPKANPLEYLLKNLDRSRRITAGKIIREAIATRDELDQLLFRLRFADDLSLARIAQVTGITENMVQKRLKKLVLYCREKLLSVGIGSL